MFEFNGEHYATIDEFAELVGLDRALVRRKVRRREIPSVPGFARGHRLIPLSVVGRALQDHVARRYGKGGFGVRLVLTDEELADLARSEFREKP